MTNLSSDSNQTALHEADEYLVVERGKDMIRLS